MKPLCIDLCHGLGGWSEPFIEHGYRVVAFDIVDMYRQTGTPRNPEVQLVLQDILKINGSQFKDAAVIVASPPCQKYSYLAMPWSRSKSEHSKGAKELRRKWETEGPDNRLFDSCFRIQREANQATCHCECWRCNRKDIPAGGHCVRCDCEYNTGKPARYIPLIVENVRGAQPWVGRSAWNYGSFHLWGDVPALMPIQKCRKVTVYSDPRRNEGKGVHLTSRNENSEGLKIGGDWFSDPNSTCRKHGSRSNARKAASAQIAKIPYPLAEHIARVYYPRDCNNTARAVK